jgi:hypothetical protein
MRIYDAEYDLLSTREVYTIVSKIEENLLAMDMRHWKPISDYYTKLSLCSNS